MERIQNAGIKDARSLSFQFITISRISPEEILRIRINGIEVKPIRYVNEKISSHLLLGNSFDINVRDVRLKSEVAEERIGRIKSELEEIGGIPNFFGHQRFGTRRPITHIIGRCLLKGDVEGAVTAFLSDGSRYENWRVADARTYLKDTMDFKGAFKSLPKYMTYERILLKHLMKHRNDFYGAMRRLPLTLRRLFIHAYQSYLFNRFLSERMKHSIPLDEPQIGDYILKLNSSGLPSGEYYRVTAGNLSAAKKEIENGESSIAIPIIGYRQDYSGGVQGEIERRVMEEEGVKKESFRIKDMPEISSPGCLRRILSKPRELKHNVSSNEQPDLTVNFTFTLERSSYATVLLREFMKPEEIIEAGF